MNRIARPEGWRFRWLAWRNRVLASERFQRGAAASPLTRFIARRRATRLFDLVAGFVGSQVLAAVVGAGLLTHLADRPSDTQSIGAALGLSHDATLRLLGAAAALGLTQEVTADWWTLGQQGAALLGNPGAQAMIRHHHLLYADLGEPLALLRYDRATPTRLSQFWTYSRGEAEGTAIGTAPYSELMAASQQMVAQQVVGAYRFGAHQSLLDVGGGHGVFLRAVAGAFPQLRLALFDLPEVAEIARASLAELPQAAFHGGDFLRDPLPPGYDLITLVRVLHDHDDAPALALLRAVRAALPAGGRLLIAEPMAGTRGGETMEAYFGMYLWAMRSGRPRRHKEIGAMLHEAGFTSWREIEMPLPMVARVIVAQM